MSRCGIGVGQVPPERWGVVIGTCNAGLLAGEEWYAKRKRGEQPDPRLVLLVDAPGVLRGARGGFDLKGPVLSVDTACAASANAIGYAAELIRYGHADAVLTGGADAFSDILYRRLQLARVALARARRAVLVRSQGALARRGQRDARADARGPGRASTARRCWPRCSATASPPTATTRRRRIPRARGAARAIQTALRRPASTRARSTTSTATAPARRRTTRPRRRRRRSASATRAYQVAVSSTKSMIGHLLGGAGAAEAIVTVKAIDEQVAPPTANFTEPDPECDLDYVPNEAREMTIDIALSNNFAFGGANAMRPLRPPGARRERPAAAERRPRRRHGRRGAEHGRHGPGALCERLRRADGAARARRTASSSGASTSTPAAYLDPKERKRVDRLGVFSVIASRLALADAGLELDGREPHARRCRRRHRRRPDGEHGGVRGAGDRRGRGRGEPGRLPEHRLQRGGRAGRDQDRDPRLGVHGDRGPRCRRIGHVLRLRPDDHGPRRRCRLASGSTRSRTRSSRRTRELGVVATQANGAGGFALAEGGFAVVVERLGAARARGANPLGECAASGSRPTRSASARSTLRARASSARCAWRSSAPASPPPTSQPSGRTATVSRSPTRPRPRRSSGCSAPPSPSSRRSSSSASRWAPGRRSPRRSRWKAGRAATTSTAAGPVLVNSLSLGGTNISIVLAPVED